MLYLAQVIKHEISGKLGLRLLVRQETESVWTVLTEEDAVPQIIPNIQETRGSNISILLSEGLLVLVELSSKQEVESLQIATNWVLDLVETYLTSGITPSFLQQESERAEQWRQTLTLQSQELARRSLEVEARREQIQALEEGLRRNQEGDN